MNATSQRGRGGHCLTISPLRTACSAPLLVAALATGCASSADNSEPQVNPSEAAAQNRDTSQSEDARESSSNQQAPEGLAASDADDVAAEEAPETPQEVSADDEPSRDAEDSDSDTSANPTESMDVDEGTPDSAAVSTDVEGASDDEVTTEAETTQPTDPRQDTQTETGTTDGASDDVVTEAIAAPPLWYFVATDSAAIVSNLMAGNSDLPLDDPIYLDSGVYPWSPDGRKLAQVVDGEVVFYSLDVGYEVIATYPTPKFTAVSGWIPNFGPLLYNEDPNSPALGAITPDGHEVLLAEGPAELSLHSFEIAPDGSEVLWGAGESLENYDLWHSSFADGDAAEPEMLRHFEGSPILAELWSPDGAWWSFGISTYEGQTGAGVYLWKRGMAEPAQVNPEGTPYTPYFGFSGDTSLFVMHIGMVDGSGLAALSIDDDGLGPTHEIVMGEGVSPAQWAQHGSFLMYLNGEEGYLQKINEDGTAEPAIEFPNYTWDCQVLWFSETDFVANGCGESTALVFGSVVESELVTQEYPDTAAPNLALSQASACVMGWDESSISVGAAILDEYVPHEVPTLGGGLSWVEFAPDGSSIVWTENANTQFRVELEDCKPLGEPVKIRETQDAIDGATFVGSQP